MKKSIIFFSFIIYSLTCLSQQQVPTIIDFDLISRPINISEIDETKTLVFNNHTDNQEIHLLFSDSCGTATIRMFRDGVVTVEGSYACDGMINHRLSKLIDLEGNVTSATITYFFRPVRDSNWTYYNKDGKVFRTESYNNGALLNSHEF